jgi:peptide/nickel transport system substrate-binding protein
MLNRCAIWVMLYVSCSAALVHAASPPDILVVAQSLDDIVSLDPAEGFELSSVQAFTNLYQRLVQPDPEHPTVLRPTLAASWQIGPGERSLDFELVSAAAFASGHPVRPEDVIFSLRRAVKLNRAPAFILNELGWRADNVDRYLLKGAVVLQAEREDLRLPAAGG